MLKKSFRRIARPGRFWSLISLLLTIPSVVLICILIYNKYLKEGLELSNIELTFYYVGALMLFAVLIRSIISDAYALAYSERRIHCDTNIENSVYSYEKLFNEDTQQAFIIGQGFNILLQGDDFENKIKQLLEKDKTTKVTVIGTTYEFACMVNSITKEGLKSSIKQLVAIRDRLEPSQRKRFHVYFHPGAISLSAIITKPKQNDRGVIVFIPKWVTDVNIGNRMFCVIEEWEHPELFKKIFGHIRFMTDPYTSTTLDQASKDWANLP